MFIQSKHKDEWSSYSGEDLWKAFRTGNRNALSTLFLRFYERLFRYGMLFAASEESVKDGIQKLFYRLWIKRETYYCPNSIESYLFISLRRILLRDKERKTARKNRNSVFVDLGSDCISSIEDFIILQENKEERKEIYHRALDLLTARQKEALLLRIDSGMSNREISEVMGLSDKRVRNLIYEATKRLREGIRKMIEKNKLQRLNN